MTVLEAIRKSTEFFERKGLDSPRLQAESLLAHALNLPRMKLYLNFERALTAAEQDNFRELSRRRGLREPLQHIVGTVSFCGLNLACSRAALIPRPETELLAQMAWEYLQQTDAPESRVLDIGTGTGCLPIAIAHHCPHARCVSVDVSQDALQLARSNAEACKVNDRIEFIESDGFSAFEPGRRFDLIVSNPPYIPAAEIETLQPEVRDFDPRLALDGGPDGLAFYRRLAVEAREFLNSHAPLMLEFGDGQAVALRKLFSGQGWVIEAIRQDDSRRDRFLIVRRPPAP